MIYLEAFSKVLPVILLFILGAYLRRTRFLAASTVGDLKKLIVNITLPAVLFLAFAGVNLEGRHLVIVAIVFAACLLALLLGRLIGPPLGLRSPYFPALMTGFEAGMMGYAIFGAVYGAGRFSTSRWWTWGRSRSSSSSWSRMCSDLSTGAISFGQTLRNFLKTPVILAIFLGIAANRLGVLPALQGWPVSAAVVRTVELLGGLTMPLIALVIGYEVRLQRGSLLKPAEAIALRLLVWVPVGLLLNALVVRPLFGAAPVLEAAVMTMFVLPPPFVIPLFMREPEGADRTFVVNTLSLATLVTLVAFTVITVVYRP